MDPKISRLYELTITSQEKNDQVLVELAWYEF